MPVRLPHILPLAIFVLAPSALAGTLQIQPASFDFGNVAVSAGAVSTVVTITNSGSNTTITGFVGVGCTEFTATSGIPFPVTLASGEALTVNVSYDPANRTADACTYTIQDNNAVADVIQVTGDGIAPVLSVTPSQLAFADQPWASSTHETRNVTVENAGDQAFGSSNLGIALQTGVNFALGTPEGSFPVNPSESITVPVTFNPVSVGAKSDLLVVSLNNDPPGSPNPTVSLSGNGTESVGVWDDGPARTAGVVLRPTPSRGSLTIEYVVPAAGEVELLVAEVTGRVVARLRSTAASAGTGMLHCRAGQDWMPATGLYLVRVLHGGRVLGTARAVIIR